MAQGVSRWTITAKAEVSTRFNVCVICGAQRVALRQVSSPSSSVFSVSIIPPLPHEVCDSSDQAVHYHHLGPKLGDLSLTRYLAGREERSIT
jgi:hypothetical protein